MATCKECKFFQPIDQAKGNCFGHEVSADKLAAECPAKSFQLKEETKVKKGKSR